MHKQTTNNSKLKKVKLNASRRTTATANRSTFSNAMFSSAILFVLIASQQMHAAQSQGKNYTHHLFLPVGHSIDCAFITLRRNWEKKYFIEFWNRSEVEFANATRLNAVNINEKHVWLGADRLQVNWEIVYKQLNPFCSVTARQRMHSVSMLWIRFQITTWTVISLLLLRRSLMHTDSVWKRDRMCASSVAYCTSLENKWHKRRISKGKVECWVLIFFSHFFPSFFFAFLPCRSLHFVCFSVSKHEIQTARNEINLHLSIYVFATCFFFSLYLLRRSNCSHVIH